MSKENRELKGTLKAFGMMVVQMKKNLIGDNGDYYYTIGLTDGTNLMVCTSGKIFDDIAPFSKVDVGFDYIDKKLKVVDVVQLG